MAVDASLASVGLAVVFVIAAILYKVFSGSAKPSAPGSSSAKTTSAPIADTAATKKEDPSFPAGPLTIYFGSQTGTSEGFSEQLKKEGQAKGFDAKVVDLDDFDADQFLQQRLAIMVMATYGEGEPTDNANQFCKWLKEGAAAGKDAAGVGEMAFTVFGLGNRQYEEYNKVGRDTDEYLEAMGAQRCFELGLGDDDGTLEEDFEAWKEKLWPQLLKKFHPLSGGNSTGVLDLISHQTKNANSATAQGQPNSNHETLPELPFQVQLLPDTTNDKSESSSSSLQLVSPAAAAPSNAQASAKHFFTAPRVKVVVNRELRNVSKDGGSTRHIELDIADSTGAGLSYETADNCAVLAENRNSDVLELAQRMEWPPLTARFTTQASVAGQGQQQGQAFKPAFPTPCTVGEALTCFVDLSGMPRRTSLKDWAPFAQSAADREALLHLSGKSGKEKFKSLVEERQRSLFDLLTEDFSSVKVPFEHFLHLAPALQPRYYTISSSSSAHPKRIHLTVSVLKSSKHGGGTLEGVCSSHLARLEPPDTNGTGKRGAGAAMAMGGLFQAGGGKKSKTADSSVKTGVPRPPRPWPTCRVFVRASGFRLPLNPLTPLVMVGPGTGIAPMRALLQERSHQRKELGAANVGPSVLYFGCKDSECDFLYADELKAFQLEGTLTTLHLAFSRPGFNQAAGAAGGSKKVYVQHLMAQDEHKLELWKAVDLCKAHVYVCGGTSMGADVGKALVEVVKQGLNAQNGAAAEKYVAGLKEQGRYVQELWA